MKEESSGLKGNPELPPPLPSQCRPVVLNQKPEEAGASGERGRNRSAYPPGVADILQQICQKPWLLSLAQK